ncbi:DUF481 domain-containing protein [Caenispirillum bisanense]|uniref:DUF481 domain-containing protein n=1 Tax=Caenispirillum bisanense TaxID=414052 RepID=A0A286H1U1_9PROT|nr:DUF481 domain-containing protein [Caenispirillum bisanense]SOE01735.1 Protein of unknown function, DUF481 [Caenispirillum bisanense]
MSGHRAPAAAALALLACLTAAAPAGAAPEADERVRVRLSNGDVLSGRLLRDTPEEVVIESGVLGEVAIPRPEVTGLMSATAAGPLPPRLPPVPQRKPVLPDPAPPADEAEKPLTGELAVGLRLFSGRNDRSEIYLDGEAAIAWRDHRLSLDAEVERDRLGEEQIEDSFDTELRLDLGVDEPPTISPTARWKRDESDGIALRQEYSVLFGSPLVDEEDGRYLRLEAGPVYYHERPVGDLPDGEGIQSGVGVTWGLKAAWPLAERLRFVHDQTGLLPIGLQGSGTPWIETSTGLRYSFQEGLFLRALYDLDWDGDTPADVDPLERVLRITVGYAF